MAELKVVHYLNQFFGQVGDEDEADLPPQRKEGAVGPGKALNEALGDRAEIVRTIITGDGYFNENKEAAQEKIREFLQQDDVDLVAAGPAFNAGRYGMACGGVAEVAEELGLPFVAGIYPENPGYEMYKKHGYFIETGDSVGSMRQGISDIADLIFRYFETDGSPGKPEEAGYLPRGIRKNFFRGERGARRAVDMLVKKLNEEEYETEYPMPSFDRVEPRPAVEDLGKALVAVVTTGGIVPKGNPDKIEASSASKFGKYKLNGVTDLTSEEFETAHGGYDPVYANQDPDRVLPIDVLRELEEEGKIGELHENYYATVGNGTSVSNAKAFGKEIGKELVRDGVQAVILTST